MLGPQRMQRSSRQKMPRKYIDRYSLRRHDDSSGFVTESVDYRAKCLRLTSTVCYRWSVGEVVSCQAWVLLGSLKYDRYTWSMVPQKRDEAFVRITPCTRDRVGIMSFER